MGLIQDLIAFSSVVVLSVSMTTNTASEITLKGSAMEDGTVISISSNTVSVNTISVSGNYIDDEMVYDTNIDIEYFTEYTYMIDDIIYPYEEFEYFTDTVKVNGILLTEKIRDTREEIDKIIEDISETNETEMDIPSGLSILYEYEGKNEEGNKCIIEDTGYYRIWLPDSNEGITNKPIILSICGNGGGEFGSYKGMGLYSYIEKGVVQPDAIVVFFYRPPRIDENGIKTKPIRKEFVSAVLDDLYNNYANYGLTNKPSEDLYFYGFSQGAWNFSSYLDVGEFKGACLIDGYNVNFKSETSLERVMVIQSYENYVEAYRSTLESMNVNAIIYDFTSIPNHPASNWFVCSNSLSDMQRYYGSTPYEIEPINAIDYMLYGLRTE